MRLASLLLSFCSLASGHPADRLSSATRLPAIFKISKATWNSLNESVGGRLYSAAPAALGCYHQYNNGASLVATTPNVTSCATASTKEHNDNFLVDNFGAYVDYGFSTCMSKNVGCPVKATDYLASTCFQGSVPSYYIDVRKASDVSEAFRFATKHHIPLVIKNTGHDLKGRSAAPNSLAIWTHNFQPPITFDENFTPELCSQSAGPTVTYGAGQSFDGLYEEAHKRGYMLVGGTSPTVGASGGWVMGGGHSVLSNVYGLGVDNVIQMKAMLPNGTIVTANRCQNQDIFFALRGGGGSTFAVLLETTSRIHPEVPLQYAFIAVPALSTKAGKSIMDISVDNTPQWAKDGWGGYLIAGVKSIHALIIILVTPKLTLEEAKESLHPIVTFAHSVGNLSVPAITNIKTVANYYEFFQTFIAHEVGVYGDGKTFVFSSRLVPKANFEGSNATILSSTMQKMILTSSAPISATLVTPASYKLPVSDQEGGPGQASVTPAWRDSLWHVVAADSWGQSDTTYGGAGSAAAAFETISKTMDPLRDITVGSGAYQNEADTYEPDYTQSFWGLENYNRLLRLKRQIDPGNLLTCHQCVGWDPSDERFGCYPKL